MIDPAVLKQVRKALGLTQLQLADALGLSRVTINKMERGRLARGIPDEIGERLMALQPVLGPNVQTMPFDDAHLWDSEEDDQ